MEFTYWCSGCGENDDFLKGTVNGGLQKRGGSTFKEDREGAVAYDRLSGFNEREHCLIAILCMLFDSVLSCDEFKKVNEDEFYSLGLASERDYNSGITKREFYFVLGKLRRESGMHVRVDHFPCAFKLCIYVGYKPIATLSGCTGRLSGAFRFREVAPLVVRRKASPTERTRKENHFFIIAHSTQHRY